MTKKVVHLTSVHPVQDVRIFHKECVSLKQAGYDVTLIAPAKQDQLLTGVNVVAVKKAKHRLKRMTIGLWQIYRKALKTKGDIYHFHDPELILVGLLLRLHGKKVIYDVHEDVPRDILMKAWIPLVFRRLIANSFELFELLAAKMFTRIVTVTPQITARFAKNNTTEVRNYPRLDEFSLVTQSNLPQSLCYSGLITKERGLYEMLNVAEATKTLLYLAGNFIDDQTLPSGNCHTQHLGFLTRDKLTALYRQSFAGLALLHPGPTFNTSLPIKLFEYMAAGIPVIASDFPLWRAIIEKHNCGFCVNPFNLSMICEKINYLKTHPQTAREMGARGREAVVNYYNWQIEFKKLLLLYQHL